MKKNEVKIGNVYIAKVSDRLTEVRIDSTNTHGGWNATNIATGKRIHVKSAQRLRRAVGGGKRHADAPAGQTPGGQGLAAAKAEARKAAKASATEVKSTDESVTGQPAPAKKSRAKKEAKPKRVSALDAAAQVLAKASKPMNSQEMIAAMAEQGLWESPNGKTPHATLYAAIIREIATKGADARFRKAERGQFESSGKGA